MPGPRRVLEYLAAALLAAVCLLTLAQVLFRYVFASPLAWSEELARFLFIWLSFLGAALCFRRGGHFHLDLLANRLQPAAARWFRLGADLLVLGFTGLLLWQGVAVLKLAFLSQYVVLGLSAGWSYLAIPVAASLMALFVLADILRTLGCRL
jgi:TRAP-type transport system small permease protein